MDFDTNEASEAREALCFPGLRIFQYTELYFPVVLFDLPLFFAGGVTGLGFGRK